MSKRSIVHVEIPAGAPAEAAEFYREMFGWETQVMQPYDYHTFASGNIGGGFPATGEHNRPGDVIVYIDSEDIDADLEKIERLGGKRLGDKMDVGGHGSLVHFSDPTGNRLALWQSTHEGE